MISRFIRRLYTVSSFRRGMIRKLVRLCVSDYRTRLFVEAVDRPHYGYCAYEAAVLAKRLGYRRISLLEFGVAGGRGLLALEAHAREISDLLNLEVETYGFDTGTGLPPPKDYRDLPYYWKGGSYSMDEDKLKENLTRSTLIIGGIGDTLTTFVDEYQPGPIAAIMFDLDYYSSTLESFKVFDVPTQYCMPRVYCYFDDILGGPKELYNDYTGVRLAIREFNESHERKKIDRIHYLAASRSVSRWYHQVYVYHDFSHELYNSFIGYENPQLPL